MISYIIIDRYHTGEIFGEYDSYEEAEEAITKQGLDPMAWRIESLELADFEELEDYEIEL